MKLEFLMEYTGDVQDGPTRNTGAGPFGTRGLAVAGGGKFEGPRLKGTIWASGGGTGFWRVRTGSRGWMFV